MKVLIVAHFFPMPDRQADMFRFAHLLRLLAANHQLVFFARQVARQIQLHGAETVAAYRNRLTSLGIEIADRRWVDVRLEKYDAVLFEHYAFAVDILDDVRCWQPDTKIVIDTIDVGFHRLMSKALMTKKGEDYEDALAMKRAELSTYRKADLLIAISENDKAVLHAENSRLDIAVIPLIFSTTDLSEKHRSKQCSMIFVGSFEHSANTDAIVYFCRDVLPLILKRVPDAHLRVIGSSAPASVTALAGPGIEVLGFVPDLKPLYESSDICIAPILWGGGLKGKIAEAIGLGLPVVTTSVGATGFGLSPGTDVLIGDTPGTFADAVVALHRDESLYRQIREAGWTFIKSHFSEQVVAQRLSVLFEELNKHPVKRISLVRASYLKALYLLERHVLWRLRTEGA